MSECVNKLFLRDFKELSTNDFDEALITKGTSIYEVIRVVDGVPLFLERHLERLKKSANIVNLKLWLTDDEVREQIRRLIKLNGIEDGNAKIVFNYNSKNSFLVYFLAHHYPKDDQYLNGVPTIIYHGERSNPNAKIINQNFRHEVEKKISESEVYEAILVDNNGCITEGSKSNIFMVKNNSVITAPIETVLPGITRQVIMEICKNLDIELKEQKIKEIEIKTLDALFITGTSPKVLPISKVDSLNFKSSANSIVLSIMRAYNKIIEDYIKSQK